jgi:3alpha(or 20beta)-hydroxysteroid dehydrogenase
MNFSFEGKVAVITGGANGQGRAEAVLFAQQGAAVAICDVAQEEGETLAAELRARGLQARYFALDVSVAADWDRMVTAVADWQSRIDVLVNNAGILKRKTIADYPEADWRRVIDINLTGSFLGIQKVAPFMREQRSGAIVNIGSNAAFSGHPDPAYTASKWAVRGLTKSAALELSVFGVRVNCVCPGLVVTDINRNAPHLATMIGMTPMGRAAEVEDIAAMVAFLAGDGARMITGEEIVIDGGFTAGAAYWKVAMEAGYYGARNMGASA